MVGGSGLVFLVLGPVEVRDGGRSLSLGGPKQRALLADLILNAPTVISTAQLIDDLWGDTAPASADHTVETYIARLRRVLRDGTRSEVLLTRAPGYLLEVGAGQVDALKFGQCLADGTAAAGRGDHAKGAALLRAGLDLWRGRALADVADVPFAGAATRALTGQYLLALERRIACDLQLGRAADLIPELETLVSRHPFHEPFYRQLMVAFYRSGRQGDALGTFRRARDVLVSELGIEPGPELRAAELAILRQDPVLHQSPDQPRLRGPAEPGPDLGQPSAPPGPRDPPPPTRPPAAELGGSLDSAAVTSWRRRLLVPVVIGAALALAAGVAVPMALRSVSTGAAIPANGVGVLSASGTAVTAGLALPSALSSLAFGGGAVWAVSAAAHAVYRIDPGTRAITQTITVGSGASGIAYAAGDVWVANALDGTVSRIDATAGQVVQTSGAGSQPTEVTAGLGAVWVTDQVGSAVYRIDPASGRVTQTIGLASPPYGVVAGAGALWVTSSAADSVTRLDPVTGQPIQTTTVGAAPTAIAYGFGSIWVANSQDSTVSRIDPGTGAVTETIPVGNGATALVVASTGVWVGDAAAATLARIDPATGRVTSALRVGDPVLAAVIVDGVPWIGTGAGFQTGHRGGTLRVLSSTWCGTYDPATGAGSCLPPVFSEATYDTLVTFRRTGGSAGLQIVPDLALAVPAPASGGTTYTFVLRPGLRYSNGVPVRPEDFRYALERDFRLSPYERSFFTGLVGAGECRTSSPCDLSSAITVDDRARTVTFHLSAPDGDFLDKLAFGFTAPVPAAVPATEVGTTPVPATGPYMITRYLPGREIDLTRNPYFRQWSAAAQPDGFPDRITWTFGLTPAQEVGQIEAGRADWMADSPPDFSVLTDRYDLQVHVNPLPGISYAAFNVTVPPFDDLRVRQAVSLAADRNRAVSALGGPSAAQPTCQVTPPGLPGYQQYCPFTTDPSATGAWVGPDLARARRLVAASGTYGMPVVVWAHQWDGPLGPYVVALLRELGYRATLRVASAADFAATVNDTRQRVQASVGTWIADYPSASDFFDLFFSCSSFRPADPADTRSSLFFCDPGIDRQMAKADQLQVSDPQAAAGAWVQVDHEITDLAPWVPLVSLRFADFTSARVGNYQYHPVWGILLDQLWVR
jgi:YVTN family beta-propeller protein